MDYVTTMVRTLTDKRPTDLTLLEAIDILRRARYPFDEIAVHITEVMERSDKCLSLNAK